MLQSLAGKSLLTHGDQHCAYLAQCHDTADFFSSQPLPSKCLPGPRPQRRPGPHNSRSLPPSPIPRITCLCHCWADGWHGCPWPLFLLVALFLMTILQAVGKDCIWGMVTYRRTVLPPHPLPLQQGHLRNNLVILQSKTQAALGCQPCWVQSIGDILSGTVAEAVRPA